MHKKIMFEFLSENPLCILGLLCACWPGIFPIVITWYLTKKGSPIQVTLRGRDVLRDDI